MVRLQKIKTMINVFCVDLLINTRVTYIVILQMILDYIGNHFTVYRDRLGKVLEFIYKIMYYTKLRLHIFKFIHRKLVTIHLMFK